MKRVKDYKNASMPTSEPASEPTGASTGTSTSAPTATPTGSTRYLLQGAQRVIAKCPPYRGSPDNPWFTGFVVSIQDSTSCTILYVDGDLSSGVLPSEIRFAPDAPANVGTRPNHRHNDLQATLNSYDSSTFTVQEVRLS